MARSKFGESVRFVAQVPRDVHSVERRSEAVSESEDAVDGIVSERVEIGG